MHRGRLCCLLLWSAAELCAAWRIVGSDLLAPGFTAAFRSAAQNGGLEVSLDFAGSNHGWWALETGRADVALITLAPGQSLPADVWNCVPLAYHAVPVVVPVASPLVQITRPQLPVICAATSGVGLRRWSELGLRDEWPVREIVSFAPPENAADLVRVLVRLIAAGLSPFAAEQASFEAGRIMLRRLRDLAAGREDFSFETTLSGKAYAPLLKTWRAACYRIRLDFLWIPDLGITRQRVRQRVSKGGHNIPDEVQQRRLHVGIRNLAELYRPLVDEWRLYDNTGHRPHLVAQAKDGVLTLADAPRLAFIEESAKVSFMSAPEDKLEEPAAMTFEEETRRPMRAMRRAYAKVVLENKAYGLPVIQWRQDRGVVEVPAEQQALLAHVKV